MDEKDSCVKLLDLLAQVLEARKGTGTATEREGFAEGLANKFFNHSFFILYLYAGTNTLRFPSGPVRISGAWSIDVLTRAAFEVFLTFHYVFSEPKTAEEKDYRFCAYRLAGLIERQRFAVTFTESAEKYKQQLHDEKTLIESLSDKLRANPVFKALLPKHQRRILGGEWRLSSWKTIAEEAGLSKLLASDTYSYLCGSAHSSSLIVSQIIEAYEKHEEALRTKPDLITIDIMTAHMISEYSELSPHSKNVLKQDQEGMSLVNFWVQIGSQLKA